MKVTICIDCGVELTDGNRSRHQAFRCRDCFDRFARGVERFLTDLTGSARQTAKAMREAAEAAKEAKK